MEHTLNIRQDESIQFTYFGRPSIGERNLLNGERPVLIDLMNQETQKSSERRKQERLKIRTGAFCLIRSNPINLTGIEYMSMGKIAMATLQSKPNKMGQLNDISMDGLSFRYVNPRDWPNESLESDITDEAFKLDILLADCQFYLSDLPFKTIFDVDIDDKLSFNTIKMRQIGISFGPLTQNKRAQLKDLMENHSINAI